MNKYLIPIDEIKNCIRFLYDNTYFTFNNNVYKQIYGTPMGSPISPFFADIVMDDLEKTCLQTLTNNYNCTERNTVIKIIITLEKITM